MEIIIKPVANPGLYRDIQESINVCATKHRTISGAFRGLQRLNSRSRSWARSCGQWGGFEIWLDGKQIDHDEVGYLLFTLDEHDHAVPPEEQFKRLITAELARRDA